MREYEGIDIYAYLNLHYAGFPDKSGFLEFLMTESEIRSKGSLSGSWKTMFDTVAEWCNKELIKLENEFRVDIQNDLKSEIRELLSEQKGKGIELSPESVSEMISKRLDGLLFDAEDKVRSVLQLLPTGNVKLNDNGYEVRLLQLLLVIQNIQVRKNVPLFDKFTNSDLVSILQLHFEMYAGKKFNTVEKRLREFKDAMNFSSVRLKEVDEALHKYFQV